MESSLNPKKIIIAVDGFSSCGKSTFAREVAARIGYIFIDTGAMYRAVTLQGLRHGAIHPDHIDEQKLIDLLAQTDITFRFNPQRGASDIYLNGENVEEQIRSVEVSNNVSRISSIGAVREQLVNLQQQMGKQKGIVMDGRDIGTVVFPNAELKIFMTADPRIRAERRHAELAAKGTQITLEEVMPIRHAPLVRCVRPKMPSYSTIATCPLNRRSIGHCNKSTDLPTKQSSTGTFYSYFDNSRKIKE